ncbi:MAG TPA: Flp pilus assembly protein CpaB [Caulobacteraceae bacterium]|nr:Flp pilus assembly protein CpaB [Caulobacteraceae bacterium]
MRTGTVVSLGASAVLGAGALIVARVWLPQPSHGPQSAASATPQQTVPVVVASGDIAYGAKLDASKLTVEQLPAGDAPRGAYASPQQILQQTGGPPIVLTPIAAHEPVLPDKLSGAGARPTVAAVIGEGMRAYTIGVTDVAGVGGHVLPGDRVDVVLTRTFTPVDKKAQADCGDCKMFVSDVVLQDVRVLGMDLNADPTSTQAAVAHTATLEVSVADAQKLAAVTQAGSLSLALRRTGNAEVAPTKSFAISNVVRLPNALPQVIPVAHRKGATDNRSILIRTRSVVVVHGDSSSSVEVPAERFGRGA